MISKQNRAFVPALIAVCVLFIFSAALRITTYDVNKPVRNVDASWHVLHTINSFRSNPVAAHKFLPIVTLGGETYKDIPWGATVPDSNGNYFYTSFSSVGFIVPYLFFKAAHLPPSIFTLMIFNLIIHFSCAIALSFLIRKIAERLQFNPPVLFSAIVMSAGMYLFSVETLFSHGVIYWHHSLYQLVWIVQLTTFCGIIADNENEARSGGYNLVIFFVCSFLGPLIEWSGYVSNFAFVTVFFLRYAKFKKNTDAGNLSVVIALTLIAAIVYLLHFLSAVGAGGLLNAIFTRSKVRSFIMGSLTEELLKLLRGYWESYGLILAAVLIAVIAYIVHYFASDKKDESRRHLGFLGILLAVTCIPLLENIIMLRHAVMYTFDRLKLIIPLIVLFVFFYGMIHARVRRLLAYSVVLAVVANVYFFLNSDRVIDATDVFERNKLFERLIAKETHACSLFAADRPVRGWLNTKFKRNIYESVHGLPELTALTLKRGACNGILLIGKRIEGAPNIYQWEKVYIYDREKNETTKLRYDPIKKEVIAAIYNPYSRQAFNLTNRTWVNGFGRNFAGFFVENTPGNIDAFTLGSMIKFSNGEMRKISGVELHLNYIAVYLNGETLDGLVAGFPQKFELIE